jgi:hypothetical protein
VDEGERRVLTIPTGSRKKTAGVPAVFLFIRTSNPYSKISVAVSVVTPV